VVCDHSQAALFRYFPNAYSNPLPFLLFFRVHTATESTVSSKHYTFSYLSGVEQRTLRLKQSCATASNCFLALSVQLRIIKKKQIIVVILDSPLQTRSEVEVQSLTCNSVGPQILHSEGRTIHSSISTFSPTVVEEDFGSELVILLSHCYAGNIRVQ
jgi:hypothetical protein